MILILHLDSVQNAIQKQKGIGIITTMLKSLDAEIQESASFAIAYLSSKSMFIVFVYSINRELEECRMEIQENGGLQILLDLAQKEFPNEMQTKQQVVSAIANFAMDGMYILF